MTEFNDDPPDGSSPRKPVRGQTIALLAAVALALVAVGFVFFHRSKPEAGPDLPAPPPAPAARAPDVALPAPEVSDARVRAALGPASSRPELKTWLAGPDLLQRWVAVVANLAGGEDPRKHLAFLAPATPFLARDKEGREILDPKGYQRFDATADILSSVDPATSAAAVRELGPMLNAALHALGYPDKNFEQSLNTALDRILAAPIREGDLTLEPRGALYKFADPALESLGPVEKQLLRMGPRNTRLLQAKARELKQALGAPAPAKP